MWSYFAKYVFISFSLLALAACGGGGGDEGGDNSGGDGNNVIEVAVPTGVSATGDVQSIVVAWQSVAGIENYRVYYKDSAGVTTSDPFFPAVGTSYTHNSLSAGATYFYAVTAVNNLEQSALSAQVSATAEAVPTPPQWVGTLLIEGKDASVKLLWADAVGATRYDLYYAQGDSDSAQNFTSVANVSSPYTLTGLSNGQPYAVYIQAVNDDGTADSQTVSAIADTRMTIRNYAPTLTSAATDGSQYVMVGSGGSIYTAPLDGASKATAQVSGTPYNLLSVAYGSGQFVAVGEQGLQLTSTDGINWSQRLLANGSNKVMFANDRFYAIGQSDVFTSTDGLTWLSADHSASMCDTEVENDNYLQHMAYGANRLLVTSSTGCMKASTDNGVTWTTASAKTAESQEFLGLAFNGTEFTAISRENGPVYKFHTSADGESWTETITTGLTDPSAYTFAENLYVVTGATSITTSADGITWAEANYTNAPTGYMGFVDHTGSDFFAVGRHLQLLLSADGTTWNNTAIDEITANFDYVFFTGTQYIAIADDGGVYTSDVGAGLGNWTLVYTISLANGNISDARLDGNILSVAGHTGLLNFNSSGLLLQANVTVGVGSGNWNSVDVSNIGEIYALTFDDVNSRYLAGTKVTVGYSGNSPWDYISNQPVNVPYRDIETDGTNIITNIGSTLYHELVTNIADWSGASVAYSPGATINQVYKHGSTFYALASNSIASSSNGLSWSVVNAAPKSSGIIVHNGNEFLTIGGEYGFVTTTDFADEVVRGGKLETTYQGDIEIFDAIWDGSQYVLVGRDGFVATHPGFD